ncbi:hypothetical protein EAG_12324 [Camponotus floridanus]|uniref:Uncharacterized protein n=1 Tax=Camponotus floridanus TaxID=104421 RepID=E2A8A1_CAMFO|nr:hypothetical protein EAG_12324 [Camponotus floridanus]
MSSVCESADVCAADTSNPSAYFVADGFGIHVDIVQFRLILLECNIFGPLLDEGKLWGQVAEVLGLIRSSPMFGGAGPVRGTILPRGVGDTGFSSGLPLRIPRVVETGWFFYGKPRVEVCFVFRVETYSFCSQQVAVLLGGGEVKPVSVGVHGQGAECRANPGGGEVKPVSVGVHGQGAECRANPGGGEVKPVSVGVHGQGAECRANPGGGEVKPVSVGVHGQGAECRANPGGGEVKPVSVGVHGQGAECRANPGGGEVTPVSVGGNGQEAECRANPGGGEVTPVSVGKNGQDSRCLGYPQRFRTGRKMQRNKVPICCASRLLYGSRAPHARVRQGGSKTRWENP